MEKKLSILIIYRHDSCMLFLVYENLKFTGQVEEYRLQIQIEFETTKLWPLTPHYDFVTPNSISKLVTAVLSGH